MPVLGRLRTLGDVEQPGLVWLMSISHGFNEFFSILIPPLFPFLIPDLTIGYSEASLLVVAYFITKSAFQVPVGPFADHYSNRILLVVGMVLLAVGTAVVAFAPTYPLLVVGMVVAGIGGSTYHPTGMSLISDVESDATYGRSMGIHGTLGSLGTVIAPLLVVSVAEVAGWRTALLAGCGVGILFSVGLYVTYPRVSPASVETDRVGVSTALRQTFYEDIDFRETATRIKSYLVKPEILLLILLFLVVGGEVRAVQTFTASFAVGKTGLEESFGGTMLSVTMVAASASSMLAGGVVDRMNRNLFAAGTFLGTGLAVAALVLFPLEAVGLTIGFVLLGVVMYSVYPAANAIAANTSVAERSGSLFAVTNTASSVGGAAGAYLLGVVADFATVQVAFLTTAAIAAVGLGTAVYSKYR